MFEKIFLVLILCSKFLIVISWKPTADYCKVKCQGSGSKAEHTACKCKLIEPREMIEDNLKKFRQDMVDIHNQYRNKIASGDEKGKGYPEASNMMAVSYSLELEYIAKCYAGIFNTGHDECRDTAKPHLIAGQNIAGNSDIKIVKNNAADGMALLWYKELDDVKKDERENFIKKFDGKKYRAGNTPIGHFSQFIWWSHTFVGCARVHNEKNEKDYYRNALICNYAGTTVFADSGNIKDHPIYKAGAKCSACPKGTTCNPTYSGLCGTIAETPGEKVPLGKPSTSSRTVRIYENKLLLVFVLSVLIAV